MAGAPLPPPAHPPCIRPAGSLVRALEEAGISRPSTYAPTLALLQQRGYVRREARALAAEPLGRVLTAFLAAYFPQARPLGRQKGEAEACRRGGAGACLPCAAGVAPGRRRGPGVAAAHMRRPRSSAPEAGPALPPHPHRFHLIPIAPTPIPSLLSHPRWLRLHLGLSDVITQARIPSSHSPSHPTLSNRSTSTPASPRARLLLSTRAQHPTLSHPTPPHPTHRLHPTPPPYRSTSTPASPRAWSSSWTRCRVS